MPQKTRRRTLSTNPEDLAQQLRGLIRAVLPHAEEKVKWGNPTYILYGQNLVSIVAYRNHVNLQFFMGARLKSRLLTGTGKDLRHIKIANSSDIDRIELSRLLTEASLLAKRSSASTR